MPKRMNNLPPGVSYDPDRHGNPRYYFRRQGQPKVRLHETPGTDAFRDEVACARLGISFAVKAKTETPARPAEDSLRWLVDEYERRNRSRVSADLMERRHRMLIEICDSQTKGGARRGALPYAMMEPRHVVDIRDELRTTPGAQNNVVKSLSAMFAWAREARLVAINPCNGIRRLRSGEGFHGWTQEEVRRFEARHEAGSKARLALHLALYTGLRLGDLAKVGRQHVRDGWLSYRPGKTSGSSGVAIEIPILPELQASIEAGPTGELTFLVTDYGRPYSVDGLGNKFRQWCDQAGLPHCTAHGLRKAGATLAAENGATDDELMAIFGWTTKQQTTLYTKKASRRRLAAGAIHKLLPEQNRGRVVSPAQGVGKSETKTAKKANKNND